VHTVQLTGLNLQYPHHYQGFDIFLIVPPWSGRGECCVIARSRCRECWPRAGCRGGGWGPCWSGPRRTASPPYAVGLCTWKERIHECTSYTFFCEWIKYIRKWWLKEHSNFHNYNLKMSAPMHPDFIPISYKFDLFSKYLLLYLHNIKYNILQ